MVQGREEGVKVLCSNDVKDGMGDRRWEDGYTSSETDPEQHIIPRRLTACCTSSSDMDDELALLLASPPSRKGGRC